MPAESSACLMAASASPPSAGRSRSYHCDGNRRHGRQGRGCPTSPARARANITGIRWRASARGSTLSWYRSSPGGGAKPGLHVLADLIATREGFTRADRARAGLGQGVRGHGAHPDRPRARHRSRPDRRQRRRDRPRPSARRHRRDPARHRARRARADQPDHRADHALHRRRHGHRDDHRARVAQAPAHRIPAPPATVVGCRRGSACRTPNVAS